MPDGMVVKSDARLTGLHWHLNRLTKIIKHRNCFCIDVKFSTTSQDVYSSMDIRSSWLVLKKIKAWRSVKGSAGRRLCSTLPDNFH